MAYNFTLPDEIGAALLEMAAARNESPEMVISEGLQALQTLEQQSAFSPPLTENEFERALGVDPADLPEIDDEAKKWYASLDE